MHTEPVRLEMTCDENGRHTATARWGGGVARHFGESPRHAFETLVSALGGCLPNTDVVWVGDTVPPLVIEPAEPAEPAEPVAAEPAEPEPVVEAEPVVEPVAAEPTIEAEPVEEAFDSTNPEPSDVDAPKPPKRRRR